MPSIRGLVLFASLGCAIQLQFAATSTPKPGTKDKAAINVGNETNSVTSSNDTRSLTVNPVNSTRVHNVNSSALNQSRTQPGVLNTTTQENVPLNRTELRHGNTSSGNSTVANNGIRVVINTDCQNEMEKAVESLTFAFAFLDFYLIFLPDRPTSCQNVTIGVRFAPIDEMQGCLLNINTTDVRWTNWDFPDDINAEFIKMNKSQQIKNSNKIYHLQYGFGRREDFVNEPKFDTPIYTRSSWQYFGTETQSEVSVGADAIPKVLNVGDNLTINCTVEGFPKPLTYLEIEYDVNDSEYNYSHRKGDVFYFDEVILPSASYKCFACQYQVVTSNSQTILSTKTKTADVEVTVYTTSTSISTVNTPSTSTPTVYAPSTSTPTPSLPPTPPNFCEGLPPDLCGNQSAVLKEFDEELSNFHMPLTNILDDSEGACREAIRTSICFRHFVTCPGSPRNPPHQKYCAPNCTVLSSNVCRETWENYKQLRWIHHLSTCTENGPITCPSEDPRPPLTTILIGVVFGTMLVILVLVVTYCVVKHCKMNSKKVILKPWKKDAEKPDLPYIFNDDYYKSKYGLVGDYKLSSIPRKNIHIGEVIGEGHFGTVYKALLSRQEADEEPLVVAAKCVNFYGSEEKMKEFFQEARFMGHLDHPNIVKLYGISMSHEPFYLIAEYMCEGDLRHFLQQAAGSIERRLINPDAYKEYSASTSSCNPPLLATHELMYICLQIACGMQYMTEHGHVHRDLAARNCLVGPNLLVKISDFGLSRSLYHKNYYRVHRGAELPILFCKDPSQYAIVMKKNPSFVRKYQIYFEDKTAREVFYQLQKRTCVKCNDDKSEYTSMSKLKEHLRQVHGVQFCKLCLDNLDLFTSERRVYTRQELTAHFRTGDSDGACKGHPMCKFCDERFFDRESLFFHVKKNHFWCHFCENDGKVEFYPKYSVLKSHFRKEHYLCELGQCLEEQYVNAFRSKVDLQAHVAKHHSRDMGKQEAKQARQIEVGFSYSRHKGKDEVSYSGQQTARSLNEVLIESTTVPPQDQIVPKEACPEHKITKKHSITKPAKSTTDNWPALDVPNSRTNGLTEEKTGSLATERFLYSSQAAKRKPPPGFYPTPSRSLSDPVSGPPPGFTTATHQPPGDRRQSFITDKLSNNPTKIREFKTMCNQFLHNEITARDYYMKSQELFGDDWKYIFEDCMSGLPNEEKRSELRLLHITENAPTWPKGEEHGRPSHSLSYHSGDLQTRKSKKKSGKAHKSKIKSVPKPLPSSSQPWSQSTGNSSLAVTTLDENEYPSLSTESSGTYSTHTFWSNRVALS